MPECLSLQNRLSTLTRLKGRVGFLRRLTRGSKILSSSAIPNLTISGTSAGMTGSSESSRRAWGQSEMVPLLASKRTTWSSMLANRCPSTTLSSPSATARSLTSSGWRAIGTPWMTSLEARSMRKSTWRSILKGNCLPSLSKRPFLSPVALARRWDHWRYLSDRRQLLLWSVPVHWLLSIESDKMPVFPDCDGHPQDIRHPVWQRKDW